MLWARKFPCCELTRRWKDFLETWGQQDCKRNPKSR